MDHPIVPASSPDDRVRQLEDELAVAHEALRKAEAALAEEQAAVNAFRMHCRLKIGDQVEAYLELRAELQGLLTRLELRRQAEELGVPFDVDEPFWPNADAPPAEEDTRAGILIPTDTPHDKAAEKRLYRELARRFHPDLAATTFERAYRTVIMANINEAYGQGDVSALRDLAGELEPELVAALSGGETAQIRQLQKQLLRCKRRQRRVAQEAKGLHEENTARLWRKAQQLESDGLVWWEHVRDELEAGIARMTVDVDRLRTELQAREDRSTSRTDGGHAS